MWNDLQSNFNCLYCNDNNEDDSMWGHVRGQKMHALFFT